jgi:hypothetical protein
VGGLKKVHHPGPEIGSGTADSVLQEKVPGHSKMIWNTSKMKSIAQ